MLSHVLVPLDGSTLAEKGLEHAKKLVGPTGRITLLTVVQVPEFPVYDFYPTPASVVPDYDAAIADALPRAKEYLEQVAEDIRTTLHMPTSAEVLAGDPASLIVETAEKLHVDAIVMSTHGRSGIGRWLFGSVTQKVLSGSGVPVFVVPNCKQRTSSTEPASAAAEIEQ
ncbi:MAG: universal stress protein [Chloroflexi bacterium]|nr:universal stress protein [Chloroflexota bacterium]